MNYCYAINCQSSSADKIRFFRFPSSKYQRLLWLKCCGKTHFEESSKLCERHFDETQYEKNCNNGRQKLKRNAIPTIFFHHAYDAPDVVHPSSETHIFSKVKTSSEVNAETGLSSPKHNSTSLENQLTFGNTNQLVEDNSVPLEALEEIQRLKSILHTERIRTEFEHKKNKGLQKRLVNEMIKYNQLCKKLKCINNKYKKLRTEIWNIPSIKCLAHKEDNPRGKIFFECLENETNIRFTVELQAYEYFTQYLDLPLPPYRIFLKDGNRIKWSLKLIRKLVPLMKIEENEWQIIRF